MAKSAKLNAAVVPNNGFAPEPVGVTPKLGVVFVLADDVLAAVPNVKPVLGVEPPVVLPKPGNEKPLLVVLVDGFPGVPPKMEVPFIVGLPKMGPLLFENGVAAPNTEPFVFDEEVEPPKIVPFEFEDEGGTPKIDPDVLLMLLPKTVDLLSGCGVEGVAAAGFSVLLADVCFCSVGVDWVVSFFAAGALIFSLEPNGTFDAGVTVAVVGVVVTRN